MLRTRWQAIATILFAAVLMRIWDIGDPIIHVDEQYYLLVGDHLLHGAVPFVDIWDRKPIGLFLLYAAIRLLPGDGIVAYQIVAMLFAALTALLVAKGGRMLGASRGGAVTAGIAYLIMLELLGGRGGQAPVFYNLPMTFAGLLTLRLPDLAQRRAHDAIIANGLAACLLAGLAIQIKYTAAVEGAFFGTAHLWFLIRARARWPLVGVATLGWAAAGLGPTALVLGWYAEHGLFAPFWFANFASIGLRAGYPVGQLAMRMLGIGAQLSPLVAGVILGWRWRSDSARFGVAFGWLAAAVIGFVAIGTFFDHYALPLIAPLAISAAVAMGRSGRLAIRNIGIGSGAAAGRNTRPARRCSGGTCGGPDRRREPTRPMSLCLYRRHDHLSPGRCMFADPLRLPEFPRLYDGTGRDGDR